MKKIVSIFLFLIVIAGGIGFGVNATNNLKGEKEVLPASSKQTTKKQAPAPVVKEAVKPGVPQKIRIPKIGVDATVESVGLDAEKKMEVPKGADNAGWYSLGARPGEKGNAVLDGHLDKKDGSAAVFFKVASLKAGDKILITDDKGKEYTFAVTSVTEYPYDNFPLQKVFGPTSESMLNLISCKGTWNEETHNYSHRTVVYSQLTN